MAKSKQSQRAGDKSRQVAVQGDLIVNQGIDIKEVSQLIDLHVEKAKAELVLVAQETAEKRIVQFENNLATKLNQDGVLGQLQDPGFQFSVLDASRAIASSDDENAEEFLVQLLLNRAKDPSNQSIKIATSKAIQIADKLSGTTLNGLTAVWVGCFLTPNTRIFEQRWASFVGHHKPFVEAGLPGGKLWQQDLDALDLTRLDSRSISGRIPYAEFAADKFKDYLVHGIPQSMLDERKEEFDAVKPELKGLIVAHPFKEGFKMFVCNSLEELEYILAAVGTSLNDQSFLGEIAQTNQFGGKDGQATEGFRRKLTEDEIMSKYTEWWDRLDAERFTPSGKIIGFLNAKRFIQFNPDNPAVMFEETE